MSWYLIWCFPESCDCLADEISDQYVPTATRNHHADRAEVDSDFHDKVTCLVSKMHLARLEFKLETEAAVGSCNRNNNEAVIISCKTAVYIQTRQKAAAHARNARNN